MKLLKMTKCFKIYNYLINCALKNAFEMTHSV